jgi:hypothetical protein
LKHLGSLRKISVSAFLFVLSLNASGGDPYRPSYGAGEAGMGYVCVVKNSFWSAFHNQALLAETNSTSVGFNYDNRFSLKELGTRSAGAILKSGKASIGAVYSNFGYADFKRDMAGIASALKLSDKISAGIQIDYFSARSSGEYENYQTLTFEAGILYKPNDNIRIGMHLFNPVPDRLRESYLPSRLNIGAGTNLSSALFAGIEAEMVSGHSPIIRTGFEYEAAKKLWIRGGFSSENNSFSFGLGYLAKFVLIDFAFSTHEQLGLTSSVSLIFKIH